MCDGVVPDAPSILMPPSGFHRRKFGLAAGQRRCVGCLQRDTCLDWRAFIAVLAAMPDLVERLMAAHTPTLDGRWCKGCTTPGRGTPHGRWPCVSPCWQKPREHIPAAAARPEESDTYCNLIATIRQENRGRLRTAAS